ncbi:GNAT family N-acetyltransferase [Nonomuraea spiralis]|uniref:GNAT family N-acetyltransferase n=1 Tax=Nonomuraea spiralis TaxID=46182 RepID=A0ABV5IBS9_9ACTN|nr:GNAT family N-acetyltransferase [Nonomuraea spiralis]GGS79696.1 putative acetyltransferase, GNAT [Nonomuraea spiralis]
MSLAWEPLTPDDAEALTDLLAAIEAEDHTGEVHDLDDVREQLGHHLIDLAAGTLAAREGDRIVAFGYLPVRQSATESHVMRLWGGVHPAHRRRGLGRRLIDWSLATAPPLSEKVFPGVPLEIHLNAPDSNQGLKALAEGTGFTAGRWFAEMGRPLSGDLPAFTPPPGVSIVPWSPDLDEGARNVRNESFLDHWGSVPHTPESWRDYIVGSRNFLPGSSYLALHEDRAVGVLITHTFEGYNEQSGERRAWIQIIGTLREWRGKGVASALIAHALAAFRAQGFDTTGLGVDADNPTGAVSVYARSGFEILQRSTNYVLPVTPG